MAEDRILLGGGIRHSVPADYISIPFTFGKNDTGVDVKMFGATSGAYMLWDESADSLLLVGASKIVMGTSSTFILPVKASGSTTAGDIWLDTTDNKLHFYNGSAEKVVTDS